MGPGKRFKPTIGAMIALALLLLAASWAAWQLLIPHLYESPGLLTLAQARAHSPIAFPASAANIRVATYSHWMQTVQYVSFEAPVADCTAHAKMLLPGDREVKLDTADAATFSSPFNPGAFHDLSPFDLRGIKNGVQYGNGEPGHPCVRIDTDRGVFYYYLTD